MGTTLIFITFLSEKTASRKEKPELKPFCSGSEIEDSWTKLFILSEAAGAGAVLSANVFIHAAIPSAGFKVSQAFCSASFLLQVPEAQNHLKRENNSQKCEHSYNVLPRSLQAYNRGRMWNIQAPIRRFRD